MNTAAELSSEIFQSLPAHIAVLDHQGRIIATNHAWETFAAQNEAAGEPSVAIGANYLDVCRRAISGQDASAAVALAGIEAVMSGRQAQFSMEYACHSPREQRWFNMTVIPLGMPGQGGAVINHLNITEQKRNEELLLKLNEDLETQIAQRSTALRKSEERFALSMEATQDGLWDWNIGADDGYFSPAYFRMLGYEPDQFPAEGKAWRDLIHPEDREQALQVNQDCIDGRRESFEVEFRMQARDGAWRWILGRGKCVSRDASGRAVRLVGTHVDITARKQTEMELRKWADAFEHCAHGIAMSVPGADQVMVCNSAFAKLLGRSMQEVIGTKIPLLYAPEERERIPALLAEADRTGQVRYEAHYCRGDGSTFLAEVEIVSVLDAHRKPIYRVATAQDITDRKVAERELRQRLDLQDQFAKVAATVPGMIFSFVMRPDGSSAMPFATPMIQDIYGLRPQDVRDDASPVFTLIHPDDVSRIRVSIEESVRTLSPWHDVYRINHPTKGLRWIEGHSVPGREADGSIRWHGFSHDTTDRKKLEERLRQSQKMEAVGQLAGGVAHDFRNQLMVIRGCLEVLQNPRTSAQDSTAMLNEISSAIDRSSTLIGDLLLFSRRESLKPASVDLNEVITDLAKTLPRFVGEDVRVAIMPTSAPCCVTIDTMRMNQAILNLANNARQAMPSGGTLTISTDVIDSRHPLIRDNTEASPGQYVVLSIRDTGIGMDSATLARLFEPFFTTKPVGQGTGLGLAMVYGFVKQSGGFVTVASKPGAGAEFRLHLPRTEAIATSAPKPVDKPQPAGAGAGNILLVEDEPAIRKVSALCLRQLGYTVIEAADPAEALDLLQNGKTAPDLLVTDLVMPGGSGLDLARAVREKCPGLAVLFMSGYAQADLSARGLTEIPGRYLLKPFGLKDLAQAVRSAIAESPAR